MSSAMAHVAIHPSQFPEQVRSDLLLSLRTRSVNHKFHYDSVNQAQKWLALHQAFSPSRTDPDCTAIYDFAFAAVAEEIDAPSVHVIGLGCGGGQKDTRLLKLLHNCGINISYTPSDVSVAMVLVARATTLSVISANNCHPLVCDLATADNLAEVLEKQTQASVSRLITFFGMIPNFEPQVIVSRLAALFRPADRLLFSANLAPGPDYLEGIQRILPQYDNNATRDWLMTFLLDLGVERSDGEIRFVIENNPSGGSLKRVAAYFHFDRPRHIRIEDESFEFRPGEAIRLFFSYRHTPESIRALLGQHGLQVAGQWITKSGEEGVFLCRHKLEDT